MRRHQKLSEARDALRGNPNLPFSYEKEKGTLLDEFSAFVGRTGTPPTPRKGNPHDDDSKPQDDGVDFGVPDEDEEPPSATKSPVEEEPPTYEDMDNGPLAGQGLGTVAKYMGTPRFRWGSHWEATRISSSMLDTKDGYSFSYPLDGGHFTTVTRVVAATESGAAKAIISYASDATSPEEAKLAEPWKKGDLKGKMVLLRLRVKETPTQLALFGWNTVQRELSHRRWIGIDSFLSVSL